MSMLAFVRAARQRRNPEVIAKIGGQPLSDSYARQQMRRFTRLLDNPKIPKRDLGTSKGLTMYSFRDNADRLIVLFDGERVIGYGKLETSIFDHSRLTMYNLYVDPAYRGKKLATVLHLGALHVFGKLISDTTMSMGALKAFHSVEKYGYNVRMLDTETGKPVPFTWGPNDIPVVAGHSIENSDRYALFV